MGEPLKRLAALCLAVPLLLTGCVVPYRGADAATTATVAADGYARLDAAGIEQIKASKVARLNMASGRLTKQSVGLQDGISHAPDVLIRDGVMDVEIEAPAGTVRAKTDRLRLNGMNLRSDFSEVTYFLTASSLADYEQLIRDGVERYGIDGESAERWIDSMSKRPGDTSDFALGTGEALGLGITYDLRYDGAKEVQVIIVHVSPLSAH
jgi:hypothetical protein